MCVFVHCTSAWRIGQGKPSTTAFTPACSLSSLRVHSGRWRHVTPTCSHFSESKFNIDAGCEVERADSPGINTHTHTADSASRLSSSSSIFHHYRSPPQRSEHGQPVHMGHPNTRPAMLLLVVLRRPCRRICIGFGVPPFRYVNVRWQTQDIHGERSACDVK